MVRGYRVSLYDLHIPSASNNLPIKITRSTKINSQSTFMIIHAIYSMWQKTKLKVICLMHIFPTETQKHPSRLVMSADSVGKCPLHSLVSAVLFAVLSFVLVMSPLEMV